MKRESYSNEQRLRKSVLDPGAQPRSGSTGNIPSPCRLCYKTYTRNSYLWCDMELTDIDVDRSITEAHFKANGWVLNEYISLTPMDLHMLYLKDQETGSLSVFGVSTDTFKALIKNPEACSEDTLFHMLGSVKETGARSLKYHHVSRLVAKHIAMALIETRAYHDWCREEGEGAQMHALLLAVHENGDIGFLAALAKPEASIIPIEEVEEMFEELESHACSELSE